MNKDRIEMSQQERDRLKVMGPVLDGKRTQGEAARLLKRSVRQVRRIQRRLEGEGDKGVIHKLRGRASNNQKDPALRRAVIEAYRRDYGDFGPTLAAEKLSKQGSKVCDETLRLWLLSEGLWQRRRKRDKHRSRRGRRECFGELVQTDGSVHDWLEGRGPRMTLLVMIDDATSKTIARFLPAETTEGYFDLLGRYLHKHGRMVAIYADRNSIFFATDAHGEPVLTQFGRAVQELGIELIPAGSPQAKGRVERFNGTAQDRLVKELRLEGASTIEQANAVLDNTFLPWFSRHCTVKPASPNNAHRPMHPSMSLAAILSIQERRKVANDYTIRLDNVIYQLLKPAYPGLRGGWVTVEKRLDGTVRIRFKKRYLGYHVIGPAETASGALPPNEVSKSRASRFGASPRSLAHGRTPAETQKEGCAAVAEQPSAVRPAIGRSGRTPAEPCPPEGEAKTTVKKLWRPPPEHPWRKFRIKRTSKQEDILTLAK